MDKNLCKNATFLRKYTRTPRFKIHCRLTNVFQFLYLHGVLLMKETRLWINRCPIAGASLCTLLTQKPTFAVPVYVPKRDGSLGGYGGYLHTPVPDTKSSMRSSNNGWIGGGGAFLGKVLKSSMKSSNLRWGVFWVKLGIILLEILVISTLLWKMFLFANTL